MVLAGLSRFSAVPCGLLMACASGPELVPTGAHPLDGGALPVPVDSEPPPAQIEDVPPAPSDDCAWADGQWRWADNRWKWDPGGWVRLRTGCYFAHPLMVWVPTVHTTGALFYTHGQWYRDDGQGVCEAPARC